MSHNPEDYRLTLTSTVNASIASTSKAERKAAAEANLADCLAQSILKMSKFRDEGENIRGDEVYSLEVFVFTRAELNQFMQHVADLTVAAVTQNRGPS